jgi:hypothetical protein
MAELGTARALTDGLPEWDGFDSKSSGGSRSPHIIAPLSTDYLLILQLRIRNIGNPAIGHRDHRCGEASMTPDLPLGWATSIDGRVRGGVENDAGAPQRPNGSTR